MVFLYFLLFLFEVALNESTHVGLDNGTDANIADHPWMVGIYMKDDYFLCGGTLVSPYWVLTTAECAFLDPLRIIAGSSNLDDPTIVNIDITEVHKHPNYTENSDGSPINDLCLLRLASPANGTNIAPIALPEPNSKVPEEEFVNISGWGYICDYDFPNTLQTARLLVTPFDECKEAYRKIRYTLYEEEEFCAGTFGDPVGFAFGDMGGAAEINGTMIGVLSWGDFLCTSTYRLPQVFVRISNYVDWIKDITGI